MSEQTGQDQSGPHQSGSHQGWDGDAPTARHDEAAARVVVEWLQANEIELDESAPGVFSFALPGEKKLQTPVRLDVGPHALGVHAFVCRNPDENHQAVYRWLLEKNLRMYAVAFAVDADGDIYLDARLPLSTVTTDELDRLLGSVLTYADESFNPLLELGFASAIRKEWEWRLANDQPTHNLEAFRGWLESGSDPKVD